MALKSLAPLDLAGGSLLESLGCAFVGLHFWHKSLSMRVFNAKILSSGGRLTTGRLRFRLLLLLRRLLLRLLLLWRSRLFLLLLLRTLLFFLLFGSRNLLEWGQDRVHGIAFHAWPKFNNPFLADLFNKAFENIASQVLVGHFPSSETQAGFYFIAFVQEAEHVVPLGNVIVLVHVDAELDLFQDDLFLVSLCRPLFLLVFVEEFAVVHNAANRRNSIRRYLYQIKVLFAGLSEGVLRGHDTKLAAIRINHANLACANAIIHANKTFIDAILLKSLQPCFVINAGRNPKQGKT
jgi:hypothetical protein